MKHLNIDHSLYTSSPARVSLPFRIAPTLVFYCKFARIVFRASARARNGEYSDRVWVEDSLEILGLLEAMGVHFSFSGLDNLNSLEEPCVLIGNHMSIMETVILPAIVRPFGKVTFVVKDSLLTYPVFKHIMRSRNPVAVTRTNPRQDLKTVISEGVARLDDKISVIVFPQTTRAHHFDPAAFGSIGIKLAKKAGVPVIPFALKTDAWQNGKYSKDFGRIKIDMPVKIAFGQPIEILGKGTEEHQQVIGFISRKLEEWR